MKTRRYFSLLPGALFATAFLLPQVALSHCDTLDGPVVQAARLALARQDVTPVLKWIKPEAEPEIKAAFAKTLVVRAQGTEARGLADQFFFETLVRIHRAGEGAPFTGLKPAGSGLDPAVKEADHALDTGSVDELVEAVTEHAGGGIRQRYAEALETRKHADDTVEAGRTFVSAYVEYVHYVENLHQAAQGNGTHHGERHDTVQPEAAQPHSSAQHQH